MARILGLLYMSPEPVAIPAICEKLSLTKGTVSLYLRMLEERKIIMRSWAKRQGKQKFYEMNPHLWSDLAEEVKKMVIREAQRAYTCMNLFGYTVDSVFINRILPDEMTDSYMERWKKIQNDYYRVIEESFSSSRLFTARLFDREMIGLDSLDEFGRHMFGEENPAGIFCDARPIAITKNDGTYTLSWHIPGVTRSEIDLWMKGEDLIVKTPKYMRNMVLPAVLEGKKIANAAFRGNYLKIVFTDMDAQFHEH